ncbi:MAG: YqaE/Pmp3 family membrane protein [Armatimonadota bacterium]|nr:YqaE/Pmp3 family membrane protein [Fimbriimonadaceae bacterium]MCZ8139083.1 YqaE/Pmp3 family membrane protein [Fimbriimonadaceae bacterium]
MNPLRAIVCCVIPPLGVLDRGPKAIVITTILTVLGWVPGVITALVLASQPKAA